MAAALPLVTVDIISTHMEPALQRLSQLTTLYMKQTSTGYNGSNFTVFDEGEEVLFKLNEIVPDTLFRGGAHRAFQFNGMDNSGKKLFTFIRPMGTLLISEEVKLFMDDTLISEIHLPHTFLKPVFRITDAVDNPVIRLKGQITDRSFFQLQTNDKTTIGSVNKKFRGWKKEMSSFKDDYIISFPVDLAVPFKIAVIVACVYIDFRFFEGK